MSPKNLLRKPLLAFKPYVAGRPIEEVRREYKLEGRIAKLASNENPLGTSPKALEAMHKAVEGVNIYPDDSSYYFRNKVAEKYGIDWEQVFPASGSVEAIELCAQAFLNPGDITLTSERTFATYYLVAMKSDAVQRIVPMIDGGFRYDMEALAEQLDENVKIVFLANPTNPTGTWFTSDEFDTFMDKVHPDTLVVYDSAYDEFVTTDDMPDPWKHLKAGKRILILRTFSKAFGLAGVRGGYAAGPKDIVSGLMMARTSFNMNLVSQAGCMAAIDDDEFVAKTHEHTIKELEFLREGLKDLPVTVPPSQTNFLLIDTEKDAKWLFEELQKRAIIIRPMGGYGMPKAIRVNVGLHEDNVRFLAEFKELILE